MGQILTFPASRTPAARRNECSPATRRSLEVLALDHLSAGCSARPPLDDEMERFLEARESFDFEDAGAGGSARPPLVEKMERFFEAEMVVLRWKFGEIDRAEAERRCLELLGGMRGWK